MKSALGTRLALLLVAAAPAALFAGENAVPDGAAGGPRVERRVVVQGGEGPNKVFVWRGGEEGGSGSAPMLAMLGRGYLGVQLTELTAELRSHFGVGDAGVLVGRVEADSPAAKAGLEVGDIVTAVDGEAVDSSMELSRLVRPKKDGDVVALEVMRDGRVRNLSATVAERERKSVDMGPLLWRGENWGSLADLPEKIEIEVAPALARLENLLDSPDMQDRMTRLRTRNEDLEKRLKDLEARLQDLEKRLKDASR